MSNFAELNLDKKTAACIREDVAGESIYPVVFDVHVVRCALCDQLARCQSCVVCPNVAEMIDIIQILLIWYSEVSRL